LADNHSDQLFFQHRYIAWAHEQKRNAELRIALDIIERHTTAGSVATPRKP